MKKTHIIGIAVIAIAIAIIITTAGDASSYVSFKEARELAAEGNSNAVHVVGRLKKDANNQIIGMQYDPRIDPNYFTFTLVDTNRIEQQVVYYNNKPQDFERSEQVVIIGKMQRDKFVADKILLKCPSKYVEKEIKTESAGL
jgi:cytochrome c-type biogenesis protein CcmE